MSKRRFDSVLEMLEAIQNDEFWRRYYAGLAMQGVLAERMTPEDAAKDAVAYADALIAELEANDE